jgi:hypothetical protein
MDDAIRHLAAELTRQQEELDQGRLVAEEKCKCDAERFCVLQQAWADARERLNVRAFTALGRALVKYHLDAYLPELIEYHRAWNDAPPKQQPPNEKPGGRLDLLMVLEILRLACGKGANLRDAIDQARKLLPLGLEIPMMSIERSLDTRDKDKGPNAWFGPKPGEPNRVPPHALRPKPPAQSVEGFGESVSQAKLSPRELAKKHGNRSHPGGVFLTN